MKTLITTKTKKSFRFFMSLLVLLFLTNFGYAADYYWVGGSGDWSDHSNHWATTTGGAVFHASVPSQFDNVIFDANSFSAAGQTVTVTFESYCNTFDSRDVIAGARFTSTRALHIYNGIEIDQNLIFSQTGNLTLYSGGLTVGTGDPNGAVSFYANGTVSLNNGALDVSDYSNFSHSGSFTVTTGNATFGKHATTTIRSLNLQAGSLFVGDSSTFNGHHLHVSNGNASIGNKVNFYDYGEFRINQGSLTIGNNTSFRQDHHTLWVESGNLEVGTNSTFYRYGGNTYVRNGDFIVGDSSTYKIQSHTQINNGSLIIGQDAAYIGYGGYNNQIWNGDFTLGTNTTYNSQGHTYLYTGTFNWDNSNSITNNGTIYLNSGDFHLTAGVSFNSTGNLQTLDGNLIVDAGVTASIRGSVNLRNGTIDLDPTANLDWWTNLNLSSTQAGQYDIDAGGRDFKRIQFDGSNYNTEYNFIDDVVASSDGIFMYANKINFNGHGVDVYRFYSWTGGEVWMDLTGTDTVFVDYEFRMYPSSNTHLNMDVATIKMESTNHIYFYGGYNQTYNDLYINANNTGSTQIHFEGNGTDVRDIFIKAKGTQYINHIQNYTVRNFNLDYLTNYTATPNLSFGGSWNVTDTYKVTAPANMNNNIYSYTSNTFNKFDVPAVNQWILRANTTQTFGELIPISGTCAKTVTIKGETLGAQGTFSMASGTFNGDWLILQDVNATGAGSFVADNTVDLGNVTGWTVNTIAPRDFYWVGNNGNWNVASNWSDVSGGTPGNCGIPNRLDNAIFDANSFSASGQYVNINVSADCEDMIWTNVTSGAGINGNQNVNIYGSLQLDNNMVFNHTGTFYFQSTTTGNTIKTDGVQMRQTIFRGQNQSTGEWSLLDDFNAHNNYLYFERGTFHSNGHNIDVHSFYNWTGSPANIHFTQSDTSFVKLQYEFRIYPTTNVNVYADSTDIIFENNNNHMYFYSGDYDAQYRDIIFNSFGNGGYYIHMQYPNKARDIKVTCAGNQYMYFYDQKQARNVSINYTNGAHNGNWIQMNGSNTFNSLNIHGIGNNRPTVYLHSNNNLGDVSFSNLSNLYFGGLQTMDSFTPLSGSCDRLLNFWGGNGVSMASGTFEVNWAYMYNLTASGGATFNANNILGTSYNLNGWNVNNIPPTNFYWVGGQGNWTDPNNWSYTSGGTPGVCPLPGRFDNVFFDVNSFSAPNQYVNLNTTAEFNNMLWTNVNHPRLVGGGQMNVYGSFQLDSKLSYEATGWVYFRSKTAGNVIKTAGKKLYWVRFDGEGQSTGEWTLSDDLEVHYDLYIDRGTFISDGNNISSRMFYAWTGSPTTIDLTGTEYVQVTNRFQIYPNNFNLIMDQADIRFTGTDHFYFIGGNNTYNNIEMTASNTGYSYIEFQYNNQIDNVLIDAAGYQAIRFYHNSTYNDVDIQFQNQTNNIPYVYIEGSNTFNDLSMTSTGNAGPYIYLNGNNTFNNLVSAGVGTRLYPRGNTTQQVNDLLAIGSGGFPVFFQSQNQGTQATFYKPSGTVCLDYVWMRDIKAVSDLDGQGVPMTDFFAGNNSVDLGNNSSNWAFSSCDGYYWVGGSGSWGQQTHWATSSGGTQLHTTLPTQFDDVYFDANSFTTAGEVVTVDVSDPRCRNMSWASSLFTPTMAGSGQVNVYGSLKLISNMVMAFTGDFNFKSDAAGNEINSGGHTLTNVNFIGGNDGEGEWTLVNHLAVSNSINLSNGSFITNNKEVSAKNFNSTTINTRSLDLGSSKFTIKDGQWNPSETTNFTFEKGTSEIVIKGTASSNFYGADLDYNNVTFKTTDQLASSLTGTNTYNTLRFDAGVTVTMEPVVQEAVQILALGTCADNVTLLSETPGTPATLKQTSGTVEGKFLTLEDNTATGGASFSANLSTNLGNVSGWSFTSAPVISITEETGLVDCVLNNDGWAKVTVTAGTPPFTYLWSTTETTDSIGGLIPGTYYITVTDSVGCSITEAVDVVNKPSALDPIGFTMSDYQICLGTAIDFAAADVVSNALQFDGSDDYVEIGNFASLSPTDSQPITFEAWINPVSASNGMIASKYSNGIAANSNFFVGLSNGNIQVSANGTESINSSATIPTADWTHVAVAFESGSGNTIIYINGVYDNSGTLTYNSANGSSSFVLGTVATGAVSSDYFDGTLDEVRVWDTIRSSSDIFENMTVPQSGSEGGLVAYYRLDEGTGSTVAFDKSPNAYMGTLTNMDPTSDWISPGAFTPSVTYEWDFGDFTGSTNQNETHTYANYGTYVVALATSDATGCPNIVKDTVIVSNVTASVVSTNVQCYGATNGTITITAAGGVEPYNYSIDGGTTYVSSGVFTGLAAGSYSVVVTDAISCESSAQSVTLSEPSSELTFTTVQENVICADDNNGSITVTAEGGTPPYQYSQNGGISYQPSHIFADLLPGDYTIRVRDANSCSPTDQVVTVLQQDDIPPVITCPQDITAYVTPSEGCYAIVNYDLPVATDNCELISLELASGGASGSLFPVGVNTVTYIATDASLNTSECSFTITVVDNLQPTAVCQNINIYLDEFGSVTLTPEEVDGGSYDNCDSIALSIDVNSFSCATLGDNFVVLTVTDESNNSASCTATVTVLDTIAPVTACNDITINLPDRNAYTLTQLEIDEIAFGSSDNCSFTYTLTSGTTVYDCNSVGISYAVSLTFTDPSGNTSICTANVTITDSLSVCNDPPVAVCQDFLVSSGENCDAMVTVADIDGGSYDPDGDSLTFVLDNYGPFGVGTHTVTLTVSDYEYSTSCTATVTVVDDTPPVAICQDLFIELDSTGNISITAAQVDNGSSDACGIASITVSPSSFDCSNVGANTVTLTVTDNNLNVSTCVSTVTVNDFIAPSMTCITEQQYRNPNFGGCTYVEVSGEFTPTGLWDNCATPTLDYTLSGATTGTGSSLSGVAFEVGITNVFWTLTDANNNTATCSFEVNVENDLVTTISSPMYVGDYNIRCNGGNDGSIDLTVTGGEAPYSYQWSNGDTSEDPTLLTAGTYSVVVTDAFGCTVETEITLTEPDQLVADAGYDEPICYSFSTTLNGSAAGGAGMYTYIWSPTTGLDNPTIANPVASPQATTTYTITVMDENGCVDISSMTLTVNPLPLATIEPSTPDDFCNGVTLTAYSSTTENGYAWSNYEYTQSIFLSTDEDPEGLYSVYVTDQNGCTSADPAVYTYKPENLSSAYTLLGIKELQLGEYNVVESGSVGLMGNNRKAHFKKYSRVNSFGSFVKADKINAHPTAVILKKVYEPVVAELPTMYYNTTTGVSGEIKVKKNTTTTINTEYVNLKIEKNCYVTINGSVYGKIEVDEGSTIIFTSSSIDLKELKIKGKSDNKQSSVEFTQGTQLRVTKKVDIGKHTIVNPTSEDVIFYIGQEGGSGGGGHDDDDDDGSGQDDPGHGDDDDDDDGGKNYKGELKVKADGTTFIASAYVPRGQIHVEGHASQGNYATMTGQFIADKIKSSGKYITWNWHACEDIMQPLMTVKNDAGSGGSEITTDEPTFQVYPVPNNGLFTVTIDSPIDEFYTISVYSSLGDKLFERENVEVIGWAEETIDLRNSSMGVYYVIFHNDNNHVVKKIIIRK